MNDRDVLHRLQSWYLGHCDGEWEHQRNVRISTIDNPGWSVSINLNGTPLLGKPFSEVSQDGGVELDWLRCFVRNDLFEGRGGPERLADILAVFLTWAEA